MLISDPVHPANRNTNIRTDTNANNLNFIILLQPQNIITYNYSSGQCYVINIYHINNILLTDVIIELLYNTYY